MTEQTRFEDRKKAMQELNVELAHLLNLSGGMKVQVNPDRVTLSALNAEGRSIFGSEIEITADSDGYFEMENEINFGASGSFSPSDFGMVAKINTVAAILNNWDSVCKLVNRYCGSRREMDDFFIAQNEAA